MKIKRFQAAVGRNMDVRTRQFIQPWFWSVICHGFSFLRMVLIPGQTVNQNFVWSSSALPGASIS